MRYFTTDCSRVPVAPCSKGSYWQVKRRLNPACPVFYDEVRTELPKYGCVWIRIRSWFDRPVLGMVEGLRANGDKDEQRLATPFVVSTVEGLATSGNGSCGVAAGDQGSSNPCAKIRSGTVTVLRTQFQVSPMRAPVSMISKWLTRTGVDPLTTSTKVRGSMPRLSHVVSV